MSLLEYLQTDPGCTQLAEGAIHACAPLLKDPDPAPTLQQLDRWAFELAGRMPLPWNLHAALDAIGDFLFQELGFQGDRRTYDAPENAALPLVLERRKGLPISLCILWIDQCRRLGLDAVGIALPGHFLAGLRWEPAILMVDPFHGGRAVDPAAAEIRGRKSLGTAQTWDPSFLAPVSHRDILIRLVRNLHVRFGRSEDWSNALWTATHLCLLSPHEPRVFKERALVHLMRGSHQAAEEDLVEALRILPEGDAEITAMLTHIRNR